MPGFPLSSSSQPFLSTYPLSAPGWVQLVRSGSGILQLLGAQPRETKTDRNQVAFVPFAVLGARPRPYTY